jgi:hypothetical protein
VAQRHLRPNGAEPARARARERDRLAQSIAFFVTAGMEKLYSGDTTSSASARAIAERNRSTASG